MKKLKYSNGITLIALVITIILMLILAGVIISLALGENGLFGMSKYAKKQYGEEAIREKITLMLSDYSANRYIKDENLKEYLEGQEKEGKLDIVEESDSEGTQTIVVDGYQVIIDEETLKILDMRKAETKPKISNIKTTYIDTNGIEKVATKENVLEGTSLKIVFDVNFEEGTLIGVNKGTLENGKVEYTTDGIELEVTFIVTGKIGEKEYSTTKKVLLQDLYRKQYIADVVQIGDFVNYSAGNWTANDIQKLGDMYSGARLPTVQGKFGGFEVNSSKEQSIATHSGKLPKYNGWRVLSKNEDGTIDIVHAGNPEGYSNNSGNSNVQIGIEILTQTRDWSMYEDSSTDAVNTEFSIPGSGRCVRYDNELENFSSGNSLVNLGAVYYWTASTMNSGKNIVRFAFGNYGKADGLYCFGIRPVVTLKREVLVSSSSEATSHQEPENAWNLSMNKNN